MTTVPELLAVQYENSLLRFQLIQHQATKVQQEQADLLSKMRVAVGASTTASYNPTIRQFVERPAPVEPKKKKSREAA